MTQLGVLVVPLSKGSLSSDSDKVGSGCLGVDLILKQPASPLITEVRLVGSSEIGLDSSVASRHIRT